MTHRARVPLLPVMVLLVAALIVFYPVISRLFPIVSYRPPVPPRKQRVEAEVKVWVNPRSGFYYCPNSAVYGKLQPGEAMLQEKALEAGYSPALRQRCR
jgi:hypothetical protein